MTKNNKYCPNCGENLEVSAKFCTACGYNFEEKVASDPAAQAPAKSFDVQGILEILKRKEVLIGLVVVAIAALAYFFMGGVDIAGTYSSDGVDTVKISRDGKVTATQNDSSESMEIVFYVEQSEFDDHYYPAIADKGLEIEVAVPTEYMDSSSREEINMFTTMFGFKVKETKDSFILSGKLSAETAIMMDLDLSEFAIEVDPDGEGIYMAREFFEKQ